MRDILFQIGPIKIYSYGFFIAVGIMASYALLMQEARRKKVNTQVLSNIFFWSIIWAFLGAHLSFVILNAGYFVEHPLEIFNLRSGFIFLGGFVSGVIASYVMIKKEKLDYFDVMDMVSPGLALAYAFGRIGCYMHGCCYGIVSTCLLAVQFPPDSPAGDVPYPRLPIQLLSSIVSIGIFSVLTVIRKHKHFKGQIFISYIILYSFTRFLIEFLRGEHYRQIGILDIGQWFYLALGIVSTAVYLLVKNRAYVPVKK